MFSCPGHVCQPEYVPISNKVFPPDWTAHPCALLVHAWNPEFGGEEPVMLVLVKHDGGPKVKR